MSNKDDTPYELFKQALAATAKAMSQTRDVETSFVSEAGRAEENRLVLQAPPRELSKEQAARTERAPNDDLVARMGAPCPWTQSV